MGAPVFVIVICYVVVDLLNPLLMPQEDAAGVFDEFASKPIDLRLELFSDLLEGFWVEGAAQRVVEVFDELGGVCLLVCD